MNQFTNHADDVRHCPSLSDYYLWEEPGVRASIYLGYDTIDRLHFEALRGLDWSREIGGILLGRKEQVGARTITLIEDFERVRCAPRTNGLYRLSEADSLKFETALDRRQSDTNQSLSPVGYFRSHLGQDLFLSPEDLAVVRRFFPNPESAFLVIRPLPDRTCTAAFFFWQDGHILPEFTGHEVPLSPVHIRRTPQAGTPAALNKTSPPKTARVPVRAVRSALLLLAAASLVALFSYWQKHRASGGLAYNRSGTSLALRVGQTNEGVTISWNRNAQPVLSANRAVLSIRDRDQDKTLSLNVAQLRTGGIAYRPESGNIDLDLTLFRDKSEIGRETLRALLNGSDGTPANPPKDDLSTRKLVTLTRSPTPAPKKSTGPLAEHLDERASAPIPTSALSDAPETDLAVLPFNSKNNQLPAWPIPVEPATIEPSRVQAVAPQTPLRSPPAEAPKPKIASYAGPQVIRRVSPILSRQIQSAMTSDIEIEVLANIDANGNVTNAQVVSTKGTLTGFVAKEAVRAAQQYRFQPAQENDVRVPSQMTLSFRFRRLSQ